MIMQKTKMVTYVSNNSYVEGVTNAVKSLNVEMLPDETYYNTVVFGVPCANVKDIRTALMKVSGVLFTVTEGEYE